MMDGGKAMEESTEMSIVTEENGQLILDDHDRVCLQDQAGSLHFVSRDCLPPNFFDQYGSQRACHSEPTSLSLEYGSQRACHSEPTSLSMEYGSQRACNSESTSLSMEESPQSSRVQNIQDSQETTHRTYWTRPEILQLIEAYKKNKHLFDNSTIRNEVVWRMIADEINHHTPQEVQNKFKYLKQRYVKKKDNMGPRSTGSKPFHFDFYEEFDEMFGKDPNIQPISIASTTTPMTEEQSTIVFGSSPQSSSRGSPSQSLESAPESLNSAPKRTKKANLVNSLQTFEKNARLREEAKERRHKESMTAINRLNNLMEQFLEKM